MTPRQVLGARIRAERERYVKRLRKPYPEGGWIVPSQEKVHKHLSNKFGLDVEEVRSYLTYSRSCSHPWSEGACEQCPD